jgi:hypothetical protein
VSGKTRESGSVTSLLLEPANGRSLAATLPGQFVVLRLRSWPDAPPLLRSYSLSGEPSDAHYRVSVKRNPGSVAGPYLATGVAAAESGGTKLLKQAVEGPPRGAAARISRQRVSGWVSIISYGNPTRLIL